MTHASPKKKSVNRNTAIKMAFSVERKITMSMVKNYLACLFDELSRMTSESRLGVASHPLVAILRKMSNDFSVEGDNIVDEIKPTQEELTAVARMFPSHPSEEFLELLDYLEDQPYNATFAWHIPKAGAKQWLDRIAEMFLPRIKVYQEAEEKRVAEHEAKQRERREKDRKDAEKHRIDSAKRTLVELGYTVTPPAKGKKA